jgi:hypothetical protein
MSTTKKNGNNRSRLSREEVKLAKRAEKALSRASRDLLLGGSIMRMVIQGSHIFWTTPKKPVPTANT